MIKIKSPNDCCGCTACASICSHDAIKMVPDSLGFLYPHVDESKCVDCGLCDSVCQFNENYDHSSNFAAPVAYAVRHRDINEIMKSRSGAAFAALSDNILEHGGVVYGAGYKEHFRVAHKRATTKAERDEFRGSKYVQSDLTGVFRQVKEDLNNGLIVLFSGTPCQTAGLKAYVGRRLDENLFLIDIVCHGVPSPYIWRDYILYLEKKYGSKVSYVNFRDKELYGWKAHKETIKYANGKSGCGWINYTYLFYKHIILRHSCGVCHYTNLQRPSDITLADYWGWQRTSLDFNADDKGCSLVLCNTDKGLKKFNDVKEQLNIIPTEIGKIMQPHLIKPSRSHPKRMEFERYYVDGGFEYAAKKTGMIGWHYIYEMFKKKIRNIIRLVF